MDAVYRLRRDHDRAWEADIYGALLADGYRPNKLICVHAYVYVLFS